MLRIMAIGDVTSPAAASWLSARLWEVRRQHSVDFLIVNAENAGFIIGPGADCANQLLEGGADVLTGGNHMLQNFSLHKVLEEGKRILRPLNYPDAAPGFGYPGETAKVYRILVINALGRVHMDPLTDSPFTAIDTLLKREAGKYDLAVLDFHAEATGEKLAIAHYFDGRVSVIFGTHTHVPTADTQILPKGTGYVSDLGMCGASGGIIGMSAESVLHRYLTSVSTRLQAAEGSMYADAVIFSVDESTGRTLSVERAVIE